MNSKKKYRFSNKKGGYIIFDSKGYILEAKGFGDLIWNPSLNVDKDVVGKHIDELSLMLKNNGIDRNVYLQFEIQVHIKLLKLMLENSNN